MTSIIWTGFVVFVLLMLALDLLVVNRGAHVISARKALAWTGFFIGMALGFNVLLYFMYEHHWLGIGHHVGHDLSGKDAALQFFTGWLLEYSLSLDNVFVIALIFRHFAVPKKYQHRVLFWGILGALVMRGIMIAVGAALIHKFHWMIYVFGGLLLLTAVRLMFTGDSEPEPESGFVFRTARRILPVAFPPGRDGAAAAAAPTAGAGPETEGHELAIGSPTVELERVKEAERGGFGDRFFVRVGGKLMVTPLFLVLLVVESTDVIFAVDSIPAIFGVTEDPFLVFTSNVFAILGLRSLYFALAAIMDKFRYLKTALVFVLAFVGVKMLLPIVGVKVGIEISLAVIGGILGMGVLASMLVSRKERLRRRAPVDDLTEAAEEAWRRSRRIVIFVIGITIVGLSIPIGLLPGPGGIAVAVGGLALLATEFVWARSLLNFARKRAVGMAHQVLGDKPPRPLLVIPVALAGLGLLGLLLYYRPEHTRLWWFGSIGPALAVVLWAGWSLYRWVHLRQIRESMPPRPSTPDADG